MDILDAISSRGRSSEPAGRFIEAKKHERHNGVRSVDTPYLHDANVVTWTCSDALATWFSGMI